MQQILLYNLEGKKAQQIKQLCTLQKIRFKSIAPEQYMETIGSLAGVAGMEKTNVPFTGVPFPDEMLVFVNFNDEALWDFLSRYRKAGIEPINLKAGLTPHNVTWNSIQLRDELMKEHEEIKKNREQ